jgi:hypothetical protein
MTLNIDFFCIGTAKSRSTWLTDCLNEHPEITLSKIKEPNFFVRNMSVFDAKENQWFMKSWSWYASQYSHKTNGNILGDCSIHLIHNTATAPALLKQYYPEAKLIVILRDPVRRTYSQYWYEKRIMHVSNVPDTFEAAIENKELLRRSRYYDLLKVWMDVFPEEHFHILLDFEVNSNPSAEINRLYSFLGVETDFFPPSLRDRKNVASKRHPLGVPIYRLINWIRFSGFEYIIDALKILRINRLVRYLVVRPAPYPAMELETEVRLREYYLSDVENLERLIGKNLSAWKKPGSGNSR